MRYLASLRVAFGYVIIALAVPAHEVRADTIPGLFPTGVNDSGSVLGTGTLDPHYNLSGPAQPAIVRSTDVAWLSPPSGSKWIGPSNTNSDPAGTYSYIISFDLTGLDPTTAVINGRWTSDNESEIFLNSSATGLATTRPQDPFRRLEPTFTLNSGFVFGDNTLEFRVWNGGGPTALLVSNLSGQADPIPEPSTVLLLGAGLIAFAARGRARGDSFACPSLFPPVGKLWAGPNVTRKRESRWIKDQGDPPAHCGLRSTTAIPLLSFDKAA